ncbi:HlyD family efflux transporter periplasmic adaptor subunit [Rhizobium sp. RU36D]|uniref:efflux RND transporter periplasmic adaptor subunit n=1 Tax=Rhizobium sp. RU36D TaxID=1907415 RepID=UPI0009D8F117|nr:HlyD family efflux transporter periplasmic adaptor subunit [Rhizobium sp. RU36D]SMC60411.1 HlyD family secretion protein [Rhizobium sp. RU36D]
MMIWAKRLALFLLLAALAGGLAYAMREQPQPVDTATVVSGPMRVTISQEGSTRVRDVYTVSAPIAGHLARTLLVEGDRVRADITVVAAIHPLDPPLIDRRSLAELTAARDGARASVRMAEIESRRVQFDLDLARKNLDRAVQLAKTGVMAESALQKAGTDVEVLEAQADQMRAAIELRKAELSSIEAKLSQPTETADMRRTCCVNLTAPVDGVVLSVFAKSEQPIAVGAKIAEIGDPRDLEVQVDLLSSDAVRLAPGAKAEIIDWGGDRALPATVRRVEPAGFTKVSALGIEEQRVNLVLDLDEGDPRLGHGFRVYARMTLWQSENALQVPISALFRNGREWNLFTLRDGRARQVPLEIGHMNDETAEVLSGLSQGDVVILHPRDTLADGNLVEAR